MGEVKREAVIMIPGEDAQGHYHSEESIKEVFNRADHSKIALPYGAKRESSYITQEKKVIGGQNVPKGSWVIGLSIKPAFLDKFQAVSWRFKPSEEMRSKTIFDITAGKTAWICVNCGVLTVQEVLIDAACACGVYWWRAVLEGEEKMTPQELAGLVKARPTPAMSRREPARQVPDGIEPYSKQHIDFLIKMNGLLVEERDQYAKMRRVSTGVTEQWRIKFNALKDEIVALAKDPPSEPYIKDVLMAVLKRAKDDGRDKKE
jgi:hypothetical protein